MSVNVGIVGARERCREIDIYAIHKIIGALKERYRDELTIISGGCYKGPDIIAAEYCKINDIRLIEHLPKGASFINKQQFRLSAFERNTQIACQSDFALYAFTKPSRLGGTEDTIAKYRNLIEIDKSVSVTTRTLYLIHTDFSVKVYKANLENE